MRLARRGRLQDAMWAGLCLGTGLVFYTAFRLYVAALLIFALLAALYWRRHLVATLQNGGWQAQLGRLSMIAIAIWLIVLPVVKFAQDNPETFWDRPRQVSIFTKRDQPNLALALRDNTLKHLLMFNFRGDPNGRHNLHGEPMLDPAMGILAVLGFGLALTRIRYPPNAFFLILLPVTLLGGILSVDFEAPQSLRSIAVFPALVYFIGLALAALGREAEDSLKPLPSKVWMAGFVGVLATFMVFYNGYTYFVRQANDFSSWVSFSTPETISARKMSELGPDYIYFMSPALINHPVTSFLAPDITDQRLLMPPNPLPIRAQPIRPVALFIRNEDKWIYEQAQRLYPNADFAVVSSPSMDGPVSPALYFVGLQPTNLNAIQGLNLRYMRKDADDQPARGDDKLTPSILQTEQAPMINTTWPIHAPNGTDFVAEWDGILYAPRYGPYSLRLVTPGPGQLEIDGNLLLDGQGEQTYRMLLAEGNHVIRVRAQSAMGQVALYWIPPGESEALIPQWAFYVPPISNHGLHGIYYPNDRWQGRPALERIDPVLDTYFQLPPLNRPYTVEWTGALEAPQSGIYRLGLQAITEAQLFLDGQLLVTASDQHTDVPINLTAGLHDISVRFRDSTNRSQIHLSWTTPNGDFEPIPTEYLWPPQDHYPESLPTISEIEVKPMSLSWLKTLGTPGTEPGQFSEPRDVAVLANGDVVVADTANRRVQVLDTHGNPELILTGREFPFEEPLAVGVNSRNEILVLDSTLQYIYRYDAAGNLIDRLGGPAATLYHPRGLSIFGDDTIAVSNTGYARLALFYLDGTSAGVIGQTDDSPGHLGEPTDVLRDLEGTYYVAEATKSRIQRLDAWGNTLNEWTIPVASAYDGSHLTFAPDGSIFVTGPQSHALFRYAPDGTLLNQWQTIDHVSLDAPIGIYLDAATNHLYITDVQAHQVHVFEVQTNPK